MAVQDVSNAVSSGLMLFEEFMQSALVCVRIATDPFLNLGGILVRFVFHSLLGFFDEFIDN